MWWTACAKSGSWVIEVAISRKADEERALTLKALGRPRP